MSAAIRGMVRGRAAGDRCGRPYVPTSRTSHPGRLNSARGPADVGMSRADLAAVSEGVGMGPMKWRERGRCKGVEPSVFYPEDDEDPAEEAKQVCAMCAVREACLEYALAVAREDRRLGWLHGARTSSPRAPAPPRVVAVPSHRPPPRRHGAMPTKGRAIAPSVGCPLDVVRSSSRVRRAPGDCPQAGAGEGRAPGPRDRHDGTYPQDLFEVFRDAGLLGLVIPEEYGGGGPGSSGSRSRSKRSPSTRTPRR